MTAFPLKIENGIHHMLKCFRPGQGPVLGDVAYQHHRDILFFRHLQKTKGRLTHLGHRPRCRWYVLTGQGLDRIHRQKPRPHFHRHGDYLIDITDCSYKFLWMQGMQPGRPHLDLTG